MNEKREHHIQTAVRLPESLIGRVDKLANRMSEPGRRATRAAVLRLAAFRGIDLLEAEQEKKKK